MQDTEGAGQWNKLRWLPHAAGVLPLRISMIGGLSLSLTPASPREHPPPQPLRRGDSRVRQHGQQQASAWAWARQQRPAHPRASTPFHAAPQVDPQFLRCCLPYNRDWLNTGNSVQ